MVERARHKRRLPALTVRARPGEPRQGLIRIGPLVLRCALGKGGLSTFKREGDGATPVATMRIVTGYFRRRGSVAPNTPMGLRPIGERLGWCDAQADRNYNRPVKLPYPASAERMQRDDRLYDVCLVLDWNLRPRRRGAGSAIFLHLARPGYLPTEGCVAVSARDMARLLPHLKAGRQLEVKRG
jgi:L,D-peptidoglycan transpeptidase YkuD (ErfK/YbiS/YcfS/YnhG family)